MSTKSSIMFVIVVMMLMLSVSAMGTEYFVGGGSDSLWTNADNWDLDVPEADDFAIVNADVVIDSGAVCSGGYVATGAGQVVQIDIQSEGSLTMAGNLADAYDAAAVSVTNVYGSLGVGGEYRISWAGTSTVNVGSGGSVSAGDLLIGTYGSGTLNMNGGSFVSAGGTGRLAVGILAPGILNMNAGTLAGGFLAIDSYASNVPPSHVQLDGGVINVGDLFMNDAGGSATMDITGGTLNILGWDATDKIEAFAIMGYLTGYGSANNVQAVFNGTDTVVTAIPEPATLCLLGAGIAAFLKKRK